MLRSRFSCFMGISPLGKDAGQERLQSTPQSKLPVENSHENVWYVVTNGTAKSMIDFWFEYRSTHQVENRDLHFAVETLPENQQLDQFICQRDPRQVPRSAVNCLNLLFNQGRHDWHRSKIRILYPRFQITSYRGLTRAAMMAAIATGSNEAHWSSLRRRHRLSTRQQ